jgi:cytochrome P450
VVLDHSFVPILSFFPGIQSPHRSKGLAARVLLTKMLQEVIDERNEKQNADKDYAPPREFFAIMGAKYRDGTALTTTEITGIHD